MHMYIISNKQLSDIPRMTFLGSVFEAYPHAEIYADTSPHTRNNMVNIIIIIIIFI